MKMKYLVPFLIFLLFGFSSNGQKDPFQAMFSYQIESGIADGSIGSSIAGLLYTLIGDYHSANTYSDIPVSWGVDSLDLEPYSLTEAFPLIIKKAKENQIVIISENHLKPQR